MIGKDIILGAASDHAGFPLKCSVIKYLESQGYKIKDYGTFSEERADYPDFAHALASDVSEGRLSYGILVCGSGNGISMTANKHPHVRCALCWNREIAGLARAHNNANILALPGRFITEEEAFAAVKAFLETDFEGGRHQQRVDKIDIQ